MIPSDEARARARALVHPNVANVRQYRGADTVDHAAVHRAQRWVGDHLQAELEQRLARPFCGYLGCDRRATQEISTPYDKPVNRCPEHAPNTFDVYSKFANRQGDGARIRKIA